MGPWGGSVASKSPKLLLIRELYLTPLQDREGTLAESCHGPYQGDLEHFGSLHMMASLKSCSQMKGRKFNLYLIHT